jgi:hypothetical protein
MSPFWNGSEAMGLMNWLGVVLAALSAAAVLWLFWRGRLSWSAYAWSVLPAAMLGHALARIGPEKLALKPHLYFMQSGGLALAFVVPALWLLGSKSGRSTTEMARDSAAFLLAYLAMGLVFYLLG